LSEEEEDQEEEAVHIGLKSFGNIFYLNKYWYYTYITSFLSSETDGCSRDYCLAFPGVAHRCA
jgi:hypothetical protein